MKLHRLKTSRKEGRGTVCGDWRGLTGKKRTMNIARQKVGRITDGKQMNGGGGEGTQGPDAKGAGEGDTLVRPCVSQCGEN